MPNVMQMVDRDPLSEAKVQHDYASSRWYDPATDNEPFIRRQVMLFGRGDAKNDSIESLVESNFGAGTTLDNAVEMLQQRNKALATTDPLSDFLTLGKDEQTALARTEMEGEAGADEVKAAAAQATMGIPTGGAVVPDAEKKTVTPEEVEKKRDEMFYEAFTQSPKAVLDYAQTVLTPEQISTAFVISNSGADKETIAANYENLADLSGEERQAFYMLLGRLAPELDRTFMQRIVPETLGPMISQMQNFKGFLDSVGLDAATFYDTQNEFAVRMEQEFDDPQDIFNGDGSVKPEYSKAFSRLAKQAAGRMMRGPNVGEAFRESDKQSRLKREMFYVEHGARIYQDVLNKRVYDMTMDDVRQVGQPAYADLGGLKEFALDASGVTADMLSRAAISSIPYVGVAASTAYMYGAHQHEMETELVRGGMNRVQARTLSGIMAAPYAAIEQMQIGQIRNPRMWQMLYSDLKQSGPRIWANASWQFAKRYGKTAAWETGEEYLQGLTDYATRKIAAVISEVEGLDAGAEEMLRQELWEATKMMPVVTMFGGGAIHATRNVFTGGKHLLPPEFKQAGRDIRTPANEWDNVARKRQTMQGLEREGITFNEIAEIPKAVADIAANDTMEEGDKLAALADMGYSDPQTTLRMGEANNELTESLRGLVDAENENIRQGLDNEIGEEDAAPISDDPVMSLVDRAMAVYGERLGITLEARPLADLQERYPDMEFPEGFEAVYLQDEKRVVMATDAMRGSALFALNRFAHEAFGHRGYDINPKRTELLQGIGTLLGMDFIRGEIPEFYGKDADADQVQEFLSRLVGRAFANDEVPTGKENQKAWDRLKTWMVQKLDIETVSEMTVREVAGIARELIAFGKEGDIVQEEERDEETRTELPQEKEAPDAAISREPYTEEEIREIIEEDGLAGEVENFIARLEQAAGDATMDTHGLKPLKDDQGYVIGWYNAGRVYPAGFNKQSITALKKFVKGEKALAEKQMEVVRRAYEYIIAEMGLVFDVIRAFKGDIAQGNRPPQAVIDENPTEWEIALEETGAEETELRHADEDTEGDDFYDEDGKPRFSVSDDRTLAQVYDDAVVAGEDPDRAMRHRLFVDNMGYLVRDMYEKAGRPEMDTSGRGERYSVTPINDMSEDEIRAEAERVGVIFEGWQDMFDEPRRPLFSGEKVEGSFMAQPGETLDQAYERLTERQKKRYSISEITIDDSLMPGQIDKENPPTTPEEIALHNTKVELLELLEQGEYLDYEILSAITAAETADELDENDDIERALDAIGERFDALATYDAGLERDGTRVDEWDFPTSVDEWARIAIGTTEDIGLAGYVLEDGVLLDFSGSRQGGGYDRSEDHRSLGNIPMAEDQSGDIGPTDIMNAFMRTTGAVRIDANAGSADFEARPTTQQLKVIMQMFEDAGEGFVDLQDGMRRGHLQYDSIDDVDRTIGLIRRFYNGEDIERLAIQGGRRYSVTRVYHGDKNERYGKEYSPYDVPRVPFFTTTQKEGAEWFGPAQKFDVDPQRMGTGEDLLEAAKEAGLEQDEHGFWPEIEKATNGQYSGYNENDLVFVPAVQKILSEKGFDALRVWDQLERDEIDTIIVLDSGIVSRPRHSIAQTGERAVVLTLAKRIFEGGKPTEQDAESLLASIGARKEMAPETLEKAKAAAMDAISRRDELITDKQINAALRNAEIQAHYQAKARELHDSAMKGGALFQKALDDYKAMSEQYASGIIQSLHGYGSPELAEEDVNIIDLLEQLEIEEQKRKARKKAETQDQDDPERDAPPDDEAPEMVPDELATREQIDDFLFRLKRAVAALMYAEGNLDSPNPEKAAGRRVFRKQYLETIRNLLGETVRNINYGRTRESLIRRIDRMKPTSRVATMDNEFASIMDRAFNQRVRDDVDSLMKRWNAATKKRKGQDASTRRWDKKVLPYDVATELAQMRRASRLSEEDVQDEIDELTEEVNSHAKYDGIQDEKPDIIEYDADLMRRMAILQKFGALKYKTRAEISEAVEYAESQLEEGLQAQEERVAEKKARDEQRRNIWIEAVDTARGKFDKDGITFTSPMMFYDLMNDMIRFSQSEDAKSLVRGIMIKISNANQRLRMEQVREYDRLVGAVVRAYGLKSRWAAEGKLRELGKSNPDYLKHSTQNRHLSKQELMQIVAFGEQDGYQDSVEANKRDIEAVRKELDAGDWNMINWLRRYYRESREELSKVSERITGMPIKSPDALYMPVKIYYQGGVGDVHITAQIVPKSLSTRVRTLRDMDESYGVLDLFSDRMHSNAVFKHYAELSIEFRGIFAHEATHVSIRESLGDKYHKQFYTHLTDIMTQKPLGGRTDTMGRFLMNFGIAKLWASGGPALRQLASFPAFAYDHGLAKAVKFVSELFTEEGIQAAKEVWRSPQAQARYTQGQSHLIAETFAGGGSKVEILARIKQIMRDYGMAPNKFMDILTISAMGGGIYRTYTAKHAATGVGKQTAKELAMDELWMEVEQSQQSSFISQQSKWQRGAGTVEKLAGMFTSTPQQYLSRELRDVKKALATREWDDVKQAGNVLFINHFIMPTLFNLLNILWRGLLGEEPDDDDIDRWIAFMVTGPFSGWFLGGAIVSAGVDAMVTGRKSWYGNDFIPASGFIKDGESAVLALRAILYDRDMEDAMNAMEDIVESNAALYRDAKTAYKNYSD